MVADAGEVGNLREDVHERGALIQRGGGEINDFGLPVGFSDPILDLLVVDQEILGRVVAGNVGGEEFTEGGNDSGGVFGEGEVFEGRTVGAVDETAGSKVGGEVVGLERPGEGGIEVVDEAEDGVVVDGGALVEETAGVEEDCGPGRANGVGLVHDCIGQLLERSLGIDFGLPRSRKARTGCRALNVRSAARYTISATA